ncbi:unnamed protein product [Amoebophrya sp. A25]|nr:unnamed protein product [Amoebophrya sp. A25]|eukprot:GSA25T00015257001.1
MLRNRTPNGTTPLNAMLMALIDTLSPPANPADVNANWQHPHPAWTANFVTQWKERHDHQFVLPELKNKNMTPTDMIFGLRSGRLAEAEPEAETRVGGGLIRQELAERAERAYINPRTKRVFVAEESRPPSLRTSQRGD